MSEDEKIDFAKKALRTRLPKAQINTLTYENIQDLLEPTRKEDGGNDMWSVYNVIQEKIIHGMFDVYGVNGKVRKARKIKNFQQDTRVNKDLYELAVEFAS